MVQVSCYHLSDKKLYVLVASCESVCDYMSTMWLQVKKACEDAFHCELLNMLWLLFSYHECKTYCMVTLYKKGG